MSQPNKTQATGKSGLYVKRLEQVDLGVLGELIALSWELMNARYPN